MTPNPARESSNAEPHRVRRILREDSPRAEDYERADAEVRAIRSELSALRHRLRELARVETELWFDATCNDAAGALSTAIVALYRLEDASDDHSFTKKAERSRTLWADVEANPEHYVIEAGRSR